jgi:hypothetical protein
MPTMAVLLPLVPDSKTQTRSHLDDGDDDARSQGRSDKQETNEMVLAVFLWFRSNTEEENRVRGGRKQPQLTRMMECFMGGRIHDGGRTTETVVVWSRGCLVVADRVCEGECWSEFYKNRWLKLEKEGRSMVVVCGSRLSKVSRRSPRRIRRTCRGMGYGCWPEMGGDIAGEKETRIAVQTDKKRKEMLMVFLFCR